MLVSVSSESVGNDLREEHHVNANKGRLGKIGVFTAPVLGEFSYSGLPFDAASSGLHRAS